METLEWQYPKAWNVLVHLIQDVARFREAYLIVRGGQAALPLEMGKRDGLRKWKVFIEVYINRSAQCILDISRMMPGVHTFKRMLVIRAHVGIGREARGNSAEKRQPICLWHLDNRISLPREPFRI